jgi:hypothetical protein
MRNAATTAVLRSSSPLKVAPRATIDSPMGEEVVRELRYGEDVDEVEEQLELRDLPGLGQAVVP